LLRKRGESTTPSTAPYRPRVRHPSIARSPAWRRRPTTNGSPSPPPHCSPSRADLEAGVRPCGLSALTVTATVANAIMKPMTHGIAQIAAERQRKSSPLRSTCRSPVPSRPATPRLPSPPASVMCGRWQRSPWVRKRLKSPTRGSAPVPTTPVTSWLAPPGGHSRPHDQPGIGPFPYRQRQAAPMPSAW